MIKFGNPVTQENHIFYFTYNFLDIFQILFHTTSLDLSNGLPYVYNITLMKTVIVDY